MKIGIYLTLKDGCHFHLHSPIYKVEKEVVDYPTEEEKEGEKCSVGVKKEVVRVEKYSIEV
jgi:hypothetical protein